ncbi:hypothetical protein ACQKJG_18895 [Priestia megaterium]|uniref:hypothetical protein n=1 Tax=Priestia megaterium TaxID=1404 RepID=UPI003D06E571
MGYVNIDGKNRKIVDAYAKIDGVWRKITNGYDKVDGNWKDMWKNNFPKPSFLGYPVTIVRGDTITWTTEDIPGAAYELQVRYNGGEWGPASKFFAKNTDVWGVSTSTSYNSIQFRIRAVAPTVHDKESAWLEGPVRSLTPQTLRTPSGLTYPAVITKGQRVRISWTKATDDITYEVRAIYVRADGTGSSADVFKGKGKNFVDYDVQTRFEWDKIYFTIKASQPGYYDSDTARGTEVTLLKQKLDTVPTLSAPTPSYGQKITVSWGAVSGAAQYILERRYNTGSWGRMYTGTNRTFTYTTTEKREHLTITWRVRAVSPNYLDGDWKTGPDQKLSLPPLKVTTWKPTLTASWRSKSDWGWREDNNRVYQGSWNEPPWWGNHIGCVWFDYGSIRRTLADKDIEKVRIYFYRMNTSHGYASGQAIKLHTHNHPTKPAGETKPTIKYVQGPFSSFARGEGKWITVSNEIAERIRDGLACGIALFREDEQGYLYMSTNVQLEVTYR